jgi:broad specificity phosphatase PhoE
VARQTGQVKWTKENVSQVATVNEETAWIGDTSGEIRLLALETGEEKAAALTTGIQLFVRNNMDRNVILVTHAGLIGMYSPSAVNEK